MVGAVRDWGSRRLFHLVHQNNLIYNTCWEDPRVDRKALELTAEDTVLMITSAGCNALDYLLEKPRHIYCVDVNPRQNALLELKLVAIRTLDFETFFSLFGKGKLANFPTLYHRTLRQYLSASARAHWDRQLDFFDDSTQKSSFYFRGSAGFFARLINTYIDLYRMRGTLRSLFDCASLAEQAIYYRRLRDVLWNKGFRALLSTDTALSLLGVPRSQRQQVERGYCGGIAKFMEDCVEAVFTKIPTKDNYFWWLYFSGSYTKERCPEYLKEENFLKLKEGLFQRISVHTGTLTDVLKCNPQLEISRYVLLDHMDWLSQSREGALAEEWQAILDRATPHCRLLWRSGGLKVDYVDPLRVRIKGKSRRVGDVLSYQRALAKRLSLEDRVHTYGSFYIANAFSH